MSKKCVANIDHPEGSSLIGKPGFTHAKQPKKGDGIGIKDNDKAAEQRMTLGPAYTFRGGAPNHNAHGYGHSIMQREGSMRLSGHSGAHRVGSRKK